MKIDWIQLARDVGSLRDDGESGGTPYSTKALEQIIGEDNIENAVELIISDSRGTELMMGVLRHITSEHAVRTAYAKYRSSQGQRAANAVWLIKHIAHPCSLEWIAEFLADTNAAGWGIGVLDQLVWSWRVDPDQVEHLLVIAEAHAMENVREQAAFVRKHIAARNEK